jgi:hypothetical protein
VEAVRHFYRNIVRHNCLQFIAGPGILAGRFDLKSS